MRFVMTLVFAAVAASVANAQYGNLTHNFFGPAGTQTAAFPGAVTSASGVSFVGVTNEPTVNMINTKQWTNGAVANIGEYYAFSFLTNQAVSVPSVNVNVLASNVGPKLFDIRSSLDSFTATLATESTVQGSIANVTFTLPTATFENIPAGTNLEFRIYGYSANNSGTNSQMGFISTSPASHGITVPIFAPVPEPATTTAVAALCLFAGGAIRRRLRTPA